MVHNKNKLFSALSRAPLPSFTSESLVGILCQLRVPPSFSNIPPYSSIRYVAPKTVAEADYHSGRLIRPCSRMLLHRVPLLLHNVVHTTPASGEGIYKKKRNYVQTSSNRTFARNNKCPALRADLYSFELPPEKQQGYSGGGFTICLSRSRTVPSRICIVPGVGSSSCASVSMKTELKT